LPRTCWRLAVANRLTPPHPRACGTALQAHVFRYAPLPMPSPPVPPRRRLPSWHPLWLRAHVVQHAHAPSMVGRAICGCTGASYTAFRQSCYALPAAKPHGNRLDQDAPVWCWNRLNSPSSHCMARRVVWHSPRMPPIHLHMPYYHAPATPALLFPTWRRYRVERRDTSAAGAISRRLPKQHEPATRLYRHGLPGGCRPSIDADGVVQNTRPAPPPYTPLPHTTPRAPPLSFKPPGTAPHRTTPPPPAARPHLLLPPPAATLLHAPYTATPPLPATTWRDRHVCCCTFSTWHVSLVSQGTTRHPSTLPPHLLPMGPLALVVAALPCHTFDT